MNATAKTISVVTPCYNEEHNVEELYRQVRAVMATIGRYRYEHIFIDNSSTDSTVFVLKRMALTDPNIKIIVNARNFGHIRSPFHAMCQARGDAVVTIVADLQDPPEMIADMVREWENGNSMVIGIKRTSQENPLMFWVRKRYYRLVNQLSSVETFENFTGFGLYDRRVVDLVKSFADPYPYFRGMIAEIGLPHKKLYYDQPLRKRGITKNNFYSLYDLGMLGIINHSKVPLRLTAFAGFVGAFLSFLSGFGYFLYKLLYWNRFSVGIAPLVIGIFFLGSIQLVFMGILGEYVGAIHTQVQQRPYAVELERVNFEYAPGVAEDTHSGQEANSGSDTKRLAG
jgi:glycosyltransferase involved in cell wall biosynthesis